MSAVSGACGSSCGLAVTRCAGDRQTYGDPAPARTELATVRERVGERDPGLRGAAARLLGRRPACPASRPAAPLAPHTPARPRSFRNALLERISNERGVWSGWIGLQSIAGRACRVRWFACLAGAPQRLTLRPTRGLRSLREAAPGLRRDAGRLLGRRPACPASRPTPLLAPTTPAPHAHREARS